MSLHIIIDGYNLIRRSASLSSVELNSLEEGREALIRRLAKYKRFKAHGITVVFDGTQSSNPSGRKSRVSGIEIIFSRPGELADSVIKRLAAREGQRAVVVTSDREVSDYAQRHGAAIIGSEEFERRMAMAAELDVAADTEDDDIGWRPTTKKKGPARRRSKRERRIRTRTKKL
ncbi:MAG: NYN domain-containing protein [Deltaproteobacteria bacterium]|nr:NYN domain-containing protein [Deltaproteobacteria bacterium]